MTRAGTATALRDQDTVPAPAPLIVGCDNPDLDCPG
jgi:hypothetical protein